MLASSLNSPVLNDQDVTELFGMLLEKSSHYSARQIMPVLLKFSSLKPALYSDVVRNRMKTCKDCSIALLLRQLDDPEVPDDTIERSIRSAVEEAKTNYTGVDLALVTPLVFDLRREVMQATALEMHLEEFEKEFRSLGRKFGFPDF